MLGARATRRTARASNSSLATSAASHLHDRPPHSGLGSSSGSPRRHSKCSTRQPVLPDDCGRAAPAFDSFTRDASENSFRGTGAHPSFADGEQVGSPLRSPPAGPASPDRTAALVAEAEMARSARSHSAPPAEAEAACSVRSPSATPPEPAAVSPRGPAATPAAAPAPAAALAPAAGGTAVPSPTAPWDGLFGESNGDAPQQGRVSIEDADADWNTFYRCASGGMVVVVSPSSLSPTGQREPVRRFHGTQSLVYSYAEGSSQGVLRAHFGDGTCYEMRLDRGAAASARLRRLARLAGECGVLCTGFDTAPTLPGSSLRASPRPDTPAPRDPPRRPDSAPLTAVCRGADPPRHAAPPGPSAAAPAAAAVFCPGGAGPGLILPTGCAEGPEAVAAWLARAGARGDLRVVAAYLAAEGFTAEEDLALLEEGDLLAAGMRRRDMRHVLRYLRPSLRDRPTGDLNKSAMPSGGASTVAESPVGLARTDSPSPVAKKEKGSPRVVQVGFTIQQVSSIDTVGAAFSIAFKLFYIWWDPSLVGRDAAQVDWEEVWTPRGYVKNALDLGEMERRVRAYDIETGGTVRGTMREGWVTETVRYRGVVSQSMALADFPVDRQRLTVMISSRNHSKKLEFRPAVVENIVEAQALAGWAFPTFDTSFQLSAKDNTGKRYAEFHIMLDAQRIVRFYLLNICVQLSLLLTTTFFTVAFSPDEFSDRVQLSVTMLLTAITFKMSVSEWMPRIGYLTLLDKYLIGTVLMIVVLMLENFLVALAADEFGINSILVRCCDVFAHVVLFLIWGGCHWFAYDRCIRRRGALAYVEGATAELRKTGGKSLAVLRAKSRAAAAFLISGKHRIDTSDEKAGDRLHDAVCTIQAHERGRQARRRFLARDTGQHP